jgi:hypothetical protein
MILLTNLNSSLLNLSLPLLLMIWFQVRPRSLRARLVLYLRVWLRLWMLLFPLRLLWLLFLWVLLERD